MSKYSIGQLVKVSNLNNGWEDHEGIVFEVTKLNSNGLPLHTAKGTEYSWSSAEPLSVPAVGSWVTIKADPNVRSYSTYNYPLPDLSIIKYVRDAERAAASHPAQDGASYRFMGHHSADKRLGLIRHRNSSGDNLVRIEWLEPFTVPSNGKESSMSTDVFSKLKDSLFRSVPDVYLDLQTMKAGVKVGDGIVTLDVIEPKQEGGEKQYELKINQLVDFAVPVPAWATRTTIDALSLGDIIILDNAQLAFFLKKAENANVKNPSIVALQASDRSEVTVNLATNNLFGQIGLLAVRNAFGQTDGDMGNMLPLLLSDGEGDDFSRMMAMMAMMNANNNGKNGKKGDNPMAQMLPLLFMKDGVAGGDMQKLAMLSMLTGGGGNNPMMGILMAKMFAGKGAPAALPAK